MKTCRWIAALGLAAAFGLAVPGEAGISNPLNRGKKKAQQEQIVSCIEQGAWIAYFQNEKGKLAPVRDTKNIESDQDWLDLRFAKWEGPRIRLGVLKVLNKSAEAEENGRPGKIEAPLAGIQEMLTAALYQTRRFDIIEQKRVEEVLKQHTRKDISQLSPPAIRDMGKVLGAQYLVYGTVNEWNPDRRGSTGAAKYLKGGKNEAEVAITFFLTDIGTGQVVFTTTERARMGEWSFSFSHPEAGEGAVTHNTPINYAVQAGVNKAAYNIANFLRNRKWIGAVVEVKKTGIYINAGQQQGMDRDTLLSVQSFVGNVRDPASGTILGEDLRGIGTLTVFKVETGFSIARPHEIKVGEKVKVGDRVLLASDPVLPASIPECKALDPSQTL